MHRLTRPDICENIIKNYKILAAFLACFANWQQSRDFPGILVWKYSPVMLANILARIFVLVNNWRIFLNFPYVAMLI
jgi:hypothetical protein